MGAPDRPLSNEGAAPDITTNRATDHRTMMAVAMFFLTADLLPGQCPPTHWLYANYGQIQAARSVPSRWRTKAFRKRQDSTSYLR